MATGGTYTSYNKVRAGAYLNYSVAPGVQPIVGTSGVVAASVPLSWGPNDEIITITTDDINGSGLQSLIGYNLTDSEALPIRLLMRGAQTLYLYRQDVGGTAATASFSAEDTGGTDAIVGTAVVGTATVAADGTGDTYVFTAKYPGTVGNGITVSIQERTSRPGQFQVFVTLNGIRRETFYVTDPDELMLINSNFVTIDPVGGELVDMAGITLTGGTNGTIDTSDPSGFFTALQYRAFNTICIYSEEPDFNDILVEQVNSWINDEGRWCTAVVLNQTNPYDNPNVNVVRNGYIVENANESYTVTPGLFVLFWAGMYAGTPRNTSLTNYRIQEATDIINPQSNQDLIDAIQNGIIELSMEGNDGTGYVVIEQDLSSKITFETPNEQVLAYNQCIRLQHYLFNTIKYIFNSNYVGKVQNNEAGRAAFAAQVITLCQDEENNGTLRDFRPDEDLDVRMGPDVFTVLLDLTIFPVFAMLKLYGAVTMRLDVRG